MRDVVEIDITGIEAALAALPGKHDGKKRVFTEAEDKMILKYWPVKKHRDVARIMGACENTIRARYEELVSE